MNKNEIKQIILEEIQAVINEQTEDERIAQAMETGDEDELEALAMGALDRAEQLAADSRPEDGEITPPGIEDMSPDSMLGDDPSYVEEDSLEEMARTSNVFKLKDGAGLKDVLQFMQRVNDKLKTYKSPGQKRPKKRFTPEEMKALATAMVNPDGFTSKDIIANTSYNSPAQANKFLKALEMKGLITLTSQLKKSMEPTRDPDAPETRGRKRRDAEFDMSDDPMADLDALGLGGDIDLSDPLSENKTTMSELEKYVKQQIKEAKQVRLQEAKAEKNLKDLIALGLMAANKEAVAESLQLNEEIITYAQAQELLAQGVGGRSGVNFADLKPGQAVQTFFRTKGSGLSKMGVEDAKIINVDDVSNLLPDLDAITSSPESATDVAQKVIDSGIEGVSGGGGGGGVGGELGDFSSNAVDIFGNLTQGVGDLLGVSPGAAAVVLGSAAIAGPLVYMISKAAKGKDTVMPDFADKFIARFANKIKGAAKGAGIGFKSPEKISDLNEAKNPLAAKMKEIENQGRVAALETKLAAVAEMIEETNGRLTRIDEDNEFRDMMDKGAVKEVRKQLKELERAQAKLQKEYDKVSGGRKKTKVVDELDADSARDKADNLDALADKQDALDQEAEDSMEEVSFELNETVARFQKLANLKG